MNDNFSTPFWGKVKPLPHYFEHGVIRFYVQEGSLKYVVRKITKTTWATLQRGHVKDKPSLDKLLSIKSLDEIPLLTEVVN